MVLKPQDLMVVLKLVAIGERRWTYVQLAQELYMSASEVNAAVKRATRARLVSLDSGTPRPIPGALEEFLLHGVRYAFPAQLGGLTRGVKTGYAAPPLVGQILQPEEPPPVWPDPEGPDRGTSFSPLYKSAPQAARQDGELYRLLALVDALREGRARERALATQELRKRLRVT